MDNKPAHAQASRAVLRFNGNWFCLNSFIAPLLGYSVSKPWGVSMRHTIVLMME
jgi:hypothetical protein